MSQAGAHDFAHRVHAGDMARLPRQMPLLRPASVAVHDDGDMAGRCVLGATAITSRHPARPDSGAGVDNAPMLTLSGREGNIRSDLHDFLLLAVEQQCRSP